MKMSLLSKIIAAVCRDLYKKSREDFADAEEMSLDHFLRSYDDPIMEEVDEDMTEDFEVRFLGTEMSILSGSYEYIVRRINNPVHSLLKPVGDFFHGCRLVNIFKGKFLVIEKWENSMSQYDMDKVLTDLKTLHTAGLTLSPFLNENLGPGLQSFANAIVSEDTDEDYSRCLRDLDFVRFY